MSRKASLLGVVSILICSNLAHAQAGELPRKISVLGPAAPEEIRFHLDEAQLAQIGIPELAYTEKDRVVADLSEIGFLKEQKPGRIEGVLRTALGDLGFSSVREADSVVRVEFNFPGDRGTLAFVVDRENLVAEAIYPEGMSITRMDRFALRSLSLALGKHLRRQTLEADVLLRASRLWGDHPLMRIRVREITPAEERGWTNLCGVTSANLAHDATTHGMLTEYLSTGPNSYQCIARCGPGCDAWAGTSAWTVDCGEHDRCVQVHGENYGPDCYDEWNSASDDYSFAPNCHMSGW